MSMVETEPVPLPAATAGKPEPDPTWEARRRVATLLLDLGYFNGAKRFQHAVDRRAKDDQAIGEAHAALDACEARDQRIVTAEVVLQHITESTEHDPVVVTEKLSSLAEVNRALAACAGELADWPGADEALDALCALRLRLRHGGTLTGR